MHFNRWVGVIVVGVLALRLAYVFAYRSDLIVGDGLEYHEMAKAFADGDGFVLPFAPDLPHQTGRPPIWVVVLGLVSLTDDAVTLLRHQVFSALVGTTTVVLLGADRSPLSPGGSLRPIGSGSQPPPYGAVYPGLWMYERALLSETLGVRPDRRRIWAWCTGSDLPRASDRRSSWVLGCGLLALTRAELLLTSVLLVLPLIVSARTRVRGARGSGGWPARRSPRWS